MLDRLPQHIDYIRYTDAKNRLQGDFPLSTCMRLAELISPEMGLLIKQKSAIEEHHIHIELEFGVDEVANRFVMGSVTCKLLLTCQRCMQPIEHIVAIDLALAFIKKRSDEQDIAGLYDSFYIESSDPVNLFALIEDEIILSLPLIAKHEPGEHGYEQCISMSIEGGSGEQVGEVDVAYAEAEEEAKKKNPFAVLQQLKDS
ncbi:MAG: YceD family protein [Pseudomonadota bacterium]